MLFPTNVLSEQILVIPPLTDLWCTPGQKSKYTEVSHISAHGANFKKNAWTKLFFIEMATDVSIFNTLFWARWWLEWPSMKAGNL